MSQLPVVQILGGGFSGLTAAYFLIHQGFSVRLIEKEKRVGGMLGTSHEMGGLSESAANAFMATALLEEVSKEIGCPLMEKKKSAEKRYIYRNGKARRWPIGFLASLKVFKFMAFYLFFRKSVRPKAQESLEDWGRRCLGDEATHFLLLPAMQGVYATQKGGLSASLVLKTLFMKQQLAKGKLQGSVAPEKGMGQWIEKMEAYLKAKGCVFATGDRFSEDANSFKVLATNLSNAQAFVKSGAPAPTGFGELKNLSLVSATLFFSSPAPLKGFGCLFPKEENFQALGVLFNDCIFEGRVSQGHSETWILGDSVLKLSKEKVLETIQKDRARLLGSDEVPAHWTLNPWQKRIPLYSTELEKMQPNLIKPHGGVYFHGNYVDGLGLSKIVQRSKELAEQMTKELK